MQECREGRVRGSVPIAKIIRTFRGGSALLNPAIVRLEKHLAMHLQKKERGKVCSYQLKKNATALSWLFPSFNTFTCTAIVNKLLPEFQNGRGQYISYNTVPLLTVVGKHH